MYCTGLILVVLDWTHSCCTVLDSFLLFWTHSCCSRTTLNKLYSNTTRFQPRVEKWPCLTYLGCLDVVVAALRMASISSRCCSRAGRRSSGTCLRLRCLFLSIPTSYRYGQTNRMEISQLINYTDVSMCIYGAINTTHHISVHVSTYNNMYRNMLRIG